MGTNQILQMAGQAGKAESACAACRFQKKKCSDKCVLAPYFPQNDPYKFLLVHRLFGYGHVVKLIQDLPPEQRGDAVSSLVYEARARDRDPVYGCIGEIDDLKKKLQEVQSRLVSTQAELANITLQHANLLSVITGYDQGWDPSFHSASPQESQDTYEYSDPHVLDDDIVDPLQLWEPSIFWS
eukprot:PITA_01185